MTTDPVTRLIHEVDQGTAQNAEDVMNKMILAIRRTHETMPGAHYFFTATRGEKRAYAAGGSEISSVHHLESVVAFIEGTMTTIKDRGCGCHTCLEVTSRLANVLLLLSLREALYRGPPGSGS